MLVGVAYYFAGMTVGLRDARWYGSRIFPISLAVVASIFSFAIRDFQNALLAVLIPIAFLALAARGAFLTGGAHNPLPRLARIPLGIALFISVCAIAGAVIGIAVETNENYAYTSTNHNISRQGDLILYTYRFEQKNNSRSNVITDTDVLAPLPRTTGHLEYHDYQTSYRTNYGLFTYYSYPSDLRRTEPITAYWYYSYRDRLLLGYDVQPPYKLKHVVGPDGQHPDVSSAQQRFDTTKPGGITLKHNNTIYIFDQAKVKLNTLYTAPPGQTILDYDIYHWNNDIDDPDATQPMLFVYTNNSIESFDFDTNSLTPTQHLASLQNPYDINTHGSATIGRLPTGDYALFTNISRRKAKQLQTMPPKYFRRYSADGQLTEERVLPRNKQAWEYNTLQALEPYLCALMPTSFFIAAEAIDLLTPEESSFFKTEYVKMTSFWIAFAICLAASLLITHRVAQTYGFSKTTTRNWLIANTLMGLAGPLVMLTLHDWPARQPCHQCDAKRPVDNDTCPACGAGPAPPQTDGTEILAA
jgi:hypothetical protein